MESHREHELFLALWHGSLIAVLRWGQFDALWAHLRTQAGAGWFLQAAGEAPPVERASEQQVLEFLDGIETLLSVERRRDQCGMVYADNLASPQLLKIYDPDQFGGGCGAGLGAPGVAWIMSRVAPCEIPAPPLPANRRRWWQRLFS